MNKSGEAIEKDGLSKSVRTSSCRKERNNQVTIKEGVCESCSEAIDALSKRRGGSLMKSVNAGRGCGRKI
jgi:hypothetical protein